MFRLISDKLPGEALYFIAMLRPMGEGHDQEVQICGFTEEYSEAMQNMLNMIATGQWETVVLCDYGLITGLYAESVFSLHCRADISEINGIEQDYQHALEVIKEAFYAQIASTHQKKGKR